MTIPVEKRFWSKVDKGEDCWNWIGSKIGKYGQFRHDPDVVAHRVAWRLTYGPIPEGMLICHKCDNPLCCKPEHLWLGTYAQNSKDMIDKGRSMKGRISTARRRRGELHPRTYLTEEQVKKIRVLKKNPGLPRSTFWNLIHKKTWTHI